MSSYLTVRKNGILLCSFSRNDDIYQAVIPHLEYGKYSKVTESILARILEDVDDDIAKLKLAIDREKMALEHLKDTEAIYEATSSIQSLQESIDDNKRVKNFLEFMSRMLDEDIYQEKDNGEHERIPALLEWSYD